MKRIASLVLSLFVFVSCFTVFASATANQDKVRDDLQALMPGEYEQYLFPQIEKIIYQVPVSDEQYRQFREIYDEVERDLDFTPGWTLHQYSLEEMEYMLKQFYRGLAIFDLYCEFKPKVGGRHEGDVVAYIYDANGKLLGTLDGDLVPTKTGLTVPSWSLYLLGIAVLFGGACGFVIYKRRVA